MALVINPKARIVVVECSNPLMGINHPTFGSKDQMIAIHPQANRIIGKRFWCTIAIVLKKSQPSLRDLLDALNAVIKGFGCWHEVGLFPAHHVRNGLICLIRVCNLIP